MTTKKQNTIAWAAQVTAALILLQIAVFKFLAVPESVYVFSKLGWEPIGRLGSGVIELIASLLLLTSRFAWAGAVMAASVMTVAIYEHLSHLGIELVDASSGLNDHGSLFALSLAVLMACVTVAVIRRSDMRIFGGKQQNLA